MIIKVITLVKNLVTNHTVQNARSFFHEHLLLPFFLISNCFFFLVLAAMLQNDKWMELLCVRAGEFSFSSCLLFSVSFIYFVKYKKCFCFVIKLARWETLKHQVGFRFQDVNLFEFLLLFSRGLGIHVFS